MSVAEPNIAAASDSDDEPQLRDLFLFTTGDRIFAVPAEEVEGTAEAKSPAPLPHAPTPILGVVYTRGRMLTLIDPRALATEEAWSGLGMVPIVISLRSDEQLALAAESVLETITISSADIEKTGGNQQNRTQDAIAGILRHGGQTITVIDPSRLFEMAVQRNDRRRRRF